VQTLIIEHVSKENKNVLFLINHKDFICARWPSINNQVFHLPSDKLNSLSFVYNELNALLYAISIYLRHLCID
jgi:hypothetical protein